ncbi:MAG: hypothetical protein KatS3mg115_1454 [Candidatus Poribacteria bacterium]|nr:MAG: hypothetical protein KatS3mg115_1454 [Candidatus Poribacteria bacterium]
MRKRWLPIAVFGLALAAGIAWSQSLGDPFDGERFQNPNWEWENEPAQWDVGKTKPGWLHIVADPNRNLWQAYTTSHLYQEHSGDFDVATHLIAEYAANSIVAGLVAYSPTTQDHQGRDGQWGHD